MFEVSIDIKGIPEITEKLENLSGKILKEVYWEMYRATRDTIEVKAKELCPSHSGALRNSIITIPESGFPIRYKTATVIVKAGNASAPYAEAQEFGFYMTKEMFRAMAAKKKEIIPTTGLTIPRWIPGKYFMARARNYGIPIILDKMNKKIEELTK